MIKLLYIANLRLPTEKAYGIQITKMCEAIATINYQPPTISKLEVELVVPHRKNDIIDNLFDYYSIKRNFKFKKIWTPDFYPPKFLEQKFWRVYFPGKLDKASVLLKDFISGTALALYGLVSGADIIYSRDEWPLYFLSFFRKNLVYEAHRFSEHRTLFYKRFKNKNLKVVVITKRLKEDFIKIGFNPQNILVAPDGVDLNEFNINISKEEARVRVGLPPNVKIVMYTGHLFEWKGATSLLEAARNIEISKYRNIEILFIFIGGTDYEIEKFKEKARGLKNVLILGHKPHKEIPIYLKAADILVLPNSGKEEISRSYTSPLKLFEYMASGRPIVASSLPSIVEILNDKNSVLVKPDSFEDMATGLEVVFNMSDEGFALAQKALEDVKNYTWQKRAEKIKNFSKDKK